MLYSYTYVIVLSGYKNFQTMGKCKFVQEGFKLMEILFINNLAFTRKLK
jgi:hypothetical protein